MVQIYNWHLFDDMLWGVCLGHDKLPDGLFIHTSRLMGVKTENNTLHVYTHSGTHYICNLEDINLEELENSKVELQKFKIDMSFFDNVETIVKIANEKYEAELMKKLKNNDFFIELIGYTSRKTYFKKDGELIYLPTGYHCGMFQDSYLFRKFDVVDVRYMDHTDAIQFYHVSDGVERVCIKCNSTNTFTITGVGKEIQIEPEDMEIKYLTTENCLEGLFSPDCVNGKSALSRRIDNDVI